jgi:hypothetical protein
MSSNDELMIKCVYVAPQIELSGNETSVVSTLTFTPTPEDDAQTLKCHGENPSIPGSGIEDSFTFNVVCEYITHL